jgi:hypothetical protein
VDEFVIVKVSPTCPIISRLAPRGSTDELVPRVVAFVQSNAIVLGVAEELALAGSTPWKVTNVDDPRTMASPNAKARFTGGTPSEGKIQR